MVKMSSTKASFKTTNMQFYEPPQYFVSLWIILISIDGLQLVLLLQIITLYCLCAKYMMSDMKDRIIIGDSRRVEFRTILVGAVVGFRLS